MGGKGWNKVCSACFIADGHGYGYLWADTSCIDKTNSTELSEAINSMFRWYAEAEICYAYLADVPDDDHVSHRHSSFRASRWFTRGWTLQELVAPKEVHFYSKNWKFLGSRTDLKHLISSITGIPVDVLTAGDGRPPSRSIGEIFSWASHRTTTLEEDMAYSLLGLLNINMPLIYGEGSAAFMRVQEELLKRYDDESIFAWEAPPNEAITMPLSGLLSPSITYFRASHRFLKPRIWTRLDHGPTTITNKGIGIDLSLVPGDERRGQCLALLNCQIAGTDESEVQPAIRVQKLGGRQYARVDVHHIHDIPFSAHIFRSKFPATCSMIFPQNPQMPLPITAFLFDVGQALCHLAFPSKFTVKVIQASPKSSWTGTWSDILLLDYPRPPTHPSTGQDSQSRGRSQAALPSLVGGLRIEIYSGSHFLGSTRILCGIEQQEDAQSNQLSRVVSWCCIPPVPEDPFAPPADALQRLPDLPRSEWATKVKLNNPGGDWALDLMVVADITEKQGPGRVVYEISLAKSYLSSISHSSDLGQ